MKKSQRKVLGLLLLAIAVIADVTLQLRGTQVCLFRYKITRNSYDWHFDFNFPWQSFACFALALLGLWFLLASRGQQRRS